MFDNWVKRNFPTVPDNDKPIDKKYVIDTIKEYFGKPKTEKDRLKNEMVSHSYHAFTMGLMAIIYLVYHISTDTKIWLDSLNINVVIPYINMPLLYFIGLLGIIYMVLDYNSRYREARKKLKELDYNHV